LGGRAEAQPRKHREAVPDNGKWRQWPQGVARGTSSKLRRKGPGSSPGPLCVTAEGAGGDRVHES